MALHNETGAAGEELAVTYITSKGYSILHQNWRYKHWEVDIIATKDNILHFIEVKTRKTFSYGLPEERVTKKKMQNLFYAAEAYLHSNPQWKRIQFNILSITIRPNKEPDFFFIEDISTN